MARSGGFRAERDGSRTQIASVRSICQSQGVTFTAQDVLDRLADAGVRLDRGLTDADLKRIEKKYGFSFGPDQRDLLRAALPLGDAWLNWRHATAVKIRERLQAPIEGVVVAVRDKALWPASWGPRPADPAVAEQTARERLATAPALIPLYGHRYLPAAPEPGGSPVFSIELGAVTIYADDLLNYADIEFGFGDDVTARKPEADLVQITFWSELAQA
jgi:hypothetical protein